MHSEKEREKLKGLGFVNRKLEWTYIFSQVKEKKKKEKKERKNLTTVKYILF